MQIGETVTPDHTPAPGVWGLVIGRLADNYVRVRWSDMLVATTHRTHSLRRVVASELARAH